MEKYVKIGIKQDDIDKVTNDVEALLNVRFTKHESSYWGLYNLVQLSESEEIKLGYNYVDDDWREEDYKDCPLILELNNLQQPEEIVDLLCDNLPYAIPLYMRVITPGVSLKKYIFENGHTKLVYEYFKKK
ncbi:hypothetical protein [Virgibacillus sp. 6R]|uniref:hypothetical protein n=1 Tax=Metabacillus sp. 22489 TaxID=3453928 RepID=UPI0011A72491